MILLLSGGLDSAANLALLAEERLPLTLVLTADYGQRAAQKEIEAARGLARYYGYHHEVLSLKWLGDFGGNALTSKNRQVPLLSENELDHPERTRESARAVWVPNRNGLLINAAAAYADALGAAAIWVGFNREEAATFPDNSEAFLRAATESLRLSCRTKVEVRSYTTDWSKTEIVRKLKSLKRPFPFELLWVCYLGGSELCLRCESCQRYARAIRS